MLLLLAAQASVIDAERAFAAAARNEGQWTAFRRYAAADATMFDPRPVAAQRFLEARANPPHSVEWKPDEAVITDAVAPPPRPAAKP